MPGRLPSIDPPNESSESFLGTNSGTGFDAAASFLKGVIDAWNQ